MGFEGYDGKGDIEGEEIPPPTHERLRHPDIIKSVAKEYAESHVIVLKEDSGREHNWQVCLKRDDYDYDTLEICLLESDADNTKRTIQRLVAKVAESAYRDGLRHAKTAVGEALAILEKIRD